MDSDLLARKEGEEDDETIDINAHSRLLEEEDANPSGTSTTTGEGEPARRSLAASLATLGGAQTTPSGLNRARTLSIASAASATSASSAASQKCPVGANMALYQATRSAKNAAMAPRVLGGQSTLRASNYGSLVADTDSRHRLTHSRELFSSKINISTSFNPQTMQCSNCTDEPHGILCQGEGVWAEWGPTLMPRTLWPPWAKSGASLKGGCGPSTDIRCRQSRWRTRSQLGHSWR